MDCCESPHGEGMIMSRGENNHECIEITELAPTYTVLYSMHNLRGFILTCMNVCRLTNNTRGLTA